MEFVEKNKSSKKTMIVELDEQLEEELKKKIEEIERLLCQSSVPPVSSNTAECKKCAYYEYCYI